MEPFEAKNLGRVLGSQIYVGTDVDTVSHGIPFAARDIFINNATGDLFQFDGTVWVKLYTISGYGDNAVRQVLTDEEALEFNVGTTVIVAPREGVARVVRVTQNELAEKQLTNLGLGDGALPFVTSAVNDLANYYKKSEVYNKGEIDAFIGAIHTIEFQVVEQLPQVGQSNVIYLVPHVHGQSDLYDEYCWIASESKYEKIGNTDALANYYNKTEVDAFLALKADKSAFDAHEANVNNPHAVTKAQVGLGNADNTSDADKPVSTAQQAALDLKANAADVYTKAQDDALLANKADKATTYTKTENDALLDAKADKSDTYTKAQVDAKVSSVYKYLGSVRLYSDLPASGNVTGDVYNVETADPTHGVKAGDNVAWNGLSWDVLAGIVDFSDYYTKGQTDSLLNQKADASDVYNKDATDVLLSHKADLDLNGKVPPSQLSVVLEYANRGAFPNVGQANCVYVAKDANTYWRWDETNLAYVMLSMFDGEIHCVSGPYGATIPAESVVSGTYRVYDHNGNFIGILTGQLVNSTTYNGLFIGAKNKKFDHFNPANGIGIFNPSDGTELDAGVVGFDGEFSLYKSPSEWTIRNAPSALTSTKRGVYKVSVSGYSSNQTTRIAYCQGVGGSSVRITVFTGTYVNVFTYDTQQGTVTPYENGALMYAYGYGATNGQWDTTPTVNSIKAVTSGGIYNALNAKQDTLVSGTNVKTVDNQSIVGSGNVTTVKMVETTYAALKALRDAGTLIPGMQYRITDYECTTVQDNTSSAGHVFDIIVVADNESTLNKKARAALHEGDEYFANNDLAAWQLWYDIDNDQSKYAWADPVGGKGVIFRMIDEFNNDVPYDFKNIMFKRYDVSEFELVEGQYFNDLSARKEAWFNSVKTDLPFRFYRGYSDPKTGQEAVDEGYPDLLDETEEEVLGSGLTYCIIDDPEWNGYPGLLARFDAENTTYGWFYTFTNRIEDTNTDKSLTSVCHNNISKVVEPGVRHLNDNVFISIAVGRGCHDNTFGINCADNTFGDSCHSNLLGHACYGNTIGSNCTYNTLGYMCGYNAFGPTCRSNTLSNYCSSNTFGNDCSSNTFGNSCYYNTFGDWCSGNAFGDSCDNNTLRNNCSSNTFGNSCSSNTFGNDCSSNTFGNSCPSNTFGNDCSSNTFGDSCYYNTFGTSSSPIDYCSRIIIDNNCSYLDINSMDTSASPSNCLQNVHVHLGVSGLSALNHKTLTVSDRNLAYETNIVANGTTDVVVQ